DAVTRRHPRRGSRRLFGRAAPDSGRAIFREIARELQDFTRRRRPVSRLFGLSPARLAVAGITAFLAMPALGHEVRPCLLQMTELRNGHYDILWKQPSAGALAVHLL